LKKKKVSRRKSELQSPETAVRVGNGTWQTCQQNAGSFPVKNPRRVLEILPAKKSQEGTGQGSAKEITSRQG
jgi:hypothetical protein